MPGGNERYDAFISYSHRTDLNLAPAVRDALQRLAKPWNRRRALSVFLDQASLEVTAELGSSLDDRLGDTRWLILFMSTESAQSKWVGEEVAEWAATKSKNQIALVLTSGEVVWDQEARDFDYERCTAVSTGLRGVYTGQESEPLFLDLRWTKTDVPDGEKSLDLTHARFKNDIATIAAPIHGMPKDELVGKDVREFKLARRLRRAAVTGLALLTVIAVVAGVVALIQRATAIRERDESEARRLATVAEANAAEQTDLAILLALESLSTTVSDEGFQALFTALSQPVLARSPLAGHRAEVNRVAFSPDGSVLASMGGDGVIRLWDVADEREIGTLEGHDAAIFEGGFSPDGSLLATPDEDWAVRVWDVDRGEQVGAPLEGHLGVVWDTAFSPNGQLLATGSSDGTARVWDLARGEQIAVETVGTDEDAIEVWEVAFSPDGTELRWVSSDGALRSRGVAPGSEVTELVTGRGEWAQGPTRPGIAFSDDGALLAVASGDWTVQVWQLGSGGPVPLELVGHDGFVTDLAFSADGAYLASASQDRTVRLWDVGSGEQVGTALTGHDAEALAVAFRADGSLLASGSADQQVRLWDLGEGRRVGRQLDHGEWLFAVAFSPDGSIAASAGMDATISLWDVATGERVLDIADSHGEGQWVYRVAFSPDGRRIASAGIDGQLRFWDAATGNPIDAPLTGHGGWVFDAEFSPDGNVLASSGDDLAVRLWDLAAGAELTPPLQGHEDQVAALAFSRDGSLLASASWDTTVRLWDVGTGTQLGAELAGHEGAVLDVWFAPDGTLLTASSDGTVMRWDVDARSPEQVVDRDLDQEAAWTAAAFDSGGSALAAASPDGSVRLWDLATGSQLGETLAGHSLRVETLAFSWDGALVASAGEDGTVRLWPEHPQWPELACAAVGRNLSAAEWNAHVSADRSYRRQCVQYGPADAPPPKRESG